MTCQHCGRRITGASPHNPAPAWCSASCAAAWEAANPGEWVPVEEATLEQRAELLAILGKGEAC